MVIPFTILPVKLVRYYPAFFWVAFDSNEAKKKRVSEDFAECDETVS